MEKLACQVSGDACAPPLAALGGARGALLGRRSRCRSRLRSVCGVLRSFGSGCEQRRIRTGHGTELRLRVRPLNQMLGLPGVVIDHGNTATAGVKGKEGAQMAIRLQGIAMPRFQVGGKGHRTLVR